MHHILFPSLHQIWIVTRKRNYLALGTNAIKSPNHKNSVSFTYIIVSIIREMFNTLNLYNIPKTLCSFPHKQHKKPPAVFGVIL